VGAKQQATAMTGNAGACGDGQVPQLCLVTFVTVQCLSCVWYSGDSAVPWLCLAFERTAA
jgi:hypothetical protein